MKTINITIVEDEHKLAVVLRDYLQQEGFKTRLFSDGHLALQGLLNDPTDLVLLDLMLPGLDGTSICRELRKVSNVPIIMLTAKIEEIDRLLGLELGADDYICKPFSPREVIARIKAVLRRTATAAVSELPLADYPSDTQPSGNALNNIGFHLDADTASVHVKGKSGSLTAVELRLLGTLLERPGQIYNREQLMRRMYEDNRIVSDRTIDSHVKKLRQKLEALDPETAYIHSVYGIGYKFEIVDDEPANSTSVVSND